MHSTALCLTGALRPAPRSPQVVYPSGLSELPQGLAQVASVAFFAMLVLLGIDSQIGTVEVVTTVAGDLGLPWARTKASAAFFVCLGLFMPGMLLATDAGIYWLLLLDKRATLLAPFLVPYTEDS